MLTLPHCAIAEGVETVEEAWRFIPMKSETELQDPVKWVESSYLEDYTTHEVSSKHVFIQVKHFTIYTDIGDFVNNLITRLGVPTERW